MANVWPATQSQLYGELNKLADAGLIEVSDIGPRGRKEYRITEAGRATASQMYGAPGWVAHTVTNAWGYTAPGTGMGWGLIGP